MFFLHFILKHIPDMFALCVSWWAGESCIITLDLRLAPKCGVAVYIYLALNLWYLTLPEDIPALKWCYWEQNGIQLRTVCWVDKFFHNTLGHRNILHCANREEERLPPPIGSCDLDPGSTWLLQGSYPPFYTHHSIHYSSTHNITCFLSGHSLFGSVPLRT